MSAKSVTTPGPMASILDNGIRLMRMLIALMAVPFVLLAVHKFGPSIMAAIGVALRG